MKKKIMIVSILVLCLAAVGTFIMMPKKIKYESWGIGRGELSGLKGDRLLPPEALLMRDINEWKENREKYLIMMGPGSSTTMENKAVLIVTLVSALDSNEIKYSIRGIKKQHGKLLVYVDSKGEPELKLVDDGKAIFYEVFCFDLKDVEGITEVKIIRD